MADTKVEQVSLRKEVKDKTIGYLLAAFGFVAGLTRISLGEISFKFTPNVLKIHLKYATI